MSEQKELQSSIEALNETQVKLVSKRQAFYRGISYGLGFFVGGTLIVGLLIYLMSVFNTAPVVGEYFGKVLNVINATK